ncbi:MAG: hypothetical protein HYY96_00820 [Candidatus Tectomicrobia bacterium]|nr:hypothetical protein [Candidatus Tectomicrobia bacterium]
MLLILLFSLSTLWLPACGRIYLGQLPETVLRQAREAATQRARTLTVTSAPSDGRIFWSQDGTTFVPLTIGNGRTPLTYTSKNWGDRFWLRVEKEKFAPSAPRRLALSDDVTVHIELTEAPAGGGPTAPPR